MIFSSNHDMTTNPIAGTLVFLLGGIAAATYLLPFRGVKGWAPLPSSPASCACACIRPGSCGAMT